MAKSAAPLFIAGGAALLLLKGKKKKASSASSSGPSYGPNMGTEDPMGGPIYPGTGNIPVPSPSKPSGGGEADDVWIIRQSKLAALGYGVGAIDGKPGSQTKAAINAFQSDWNWFVNYLEALNPTIKYSSPYTKISTDGAWGPKTEARADKALNKLNGENPVEIEELGRKVETFREMIEGLKEI